MSWFISVPSDFFLYDNSLFVSSIFFSLETNVKPHILQNKWFDLHRLGL